MSQLSNLQVASPEVISQIASFYGSSFPMEIRYHLSDFLESKLFCLIFNEENPQYEIDARNFHEEFIHELEKKAAEMAENFQLPTKIRLIDAARNMRSQNPIAVYSHLIKCMSYEQQVLENLQYNNGNEVHQITREVSQEIENLLYSTRNCKELQREWVKNNENYRLEHHEMNVERMEDDTSPKEVIELVRELKLESLDLQLKKAKEDCDKLISTMKENVAACHNLTMKITEHFLKNWKWWQKYDGSNTAINGADLDCIQSWCEKLTESLWSTREQIRFIQSYQQQNGDNNTELIEILSQMHNEVSRSLLILINGSFIIEKQPPQVMKTNTKFQTSLRLLIGDALGLKFSPPVVSAKIISETQAQRIFQTGKYSGTPCGRIFNGLKSVEYADTSRHFTVKFDSLKLESFKRPGRRSADNVTDEKFAMFFEADIAIGDFKVTMATMSLPIVVTVHGSQESFALATIFWDNSFSDINRIPFVIPDQIPWKQFAEALSQKCINYNERGLTPENMHFLAEKFFHMSFPNGVSDDLNVSWNSFCKENLPGRNFTFWEWFHAALRVTKDHLRGPWIEGSIVGFMSKAKVEEYLIHESRHGTFLLRFSDSELGAISIAWLKKDGVGPNVLHIQPFNSKDLSQRSLSDRLSDLNELKTLYPNKPKGPTFDRFKSNEGKLQTKTRRAYVPAVMKLVVFDDQTPTTPQQWFATPSPGHQSPCEQFVPSLNHQQCMASPSQQQFVSSPTQTFYSDSSNQSADFDEQIFMNL